MQDLFCICQEADARKKELIALVGLEERKQFAGTMSGVRNSVAPCLCPAPPASFVVLDNHSRVDPVRRWKILHQLCPGLRYL